MKSSTFGKTLDFLREHGVRSYEGPTLDFSATFKVEFFAPLSAPAPVAPGEQAAPSLPPEDEKADTCACGHSFAVEHSAAGCLQGCSLALCGSTDDRPSGGA